jgi:hypothetical protein
VHPSRTDTHQALHHLLHQLYLPVAHFTTSTGPPRNQTQRPVVPVYCYPQQRNLDNMDSAVSSGAPSLPTRTRTRGHNSKPSFRNDDNHHDGNDNGDGQSPEGSDSDHSQPRCEPHKGVRAVRAGGHQNDAASGPTRTAKVSRYCDSPTMTEPHPWPWHPYLLIHSPGLEANPL